MDGDEAGVVDADDSQGWLGVLSKTGFGYFWSSRVTTAPREDRICAFSVFATDSAEEEGTAVEAGAPEMGWVRHGVGGDGMGEVSGGMAVVAG